FGEGRELFDREVADEPITRDATLRENDQTHTLGDGLFCEAFNFLEVGIFVRRFALELDGGDSKGALGLCVQASALVITFPAPSVRRWSRPSCRNVRRSWSKPSRCRIVAWM